MSDGTAAGWMQVILQALQIVGGIGGTICCLAVMLGRRLLVTRDDLSKYSMDHAKEHQLLDQRLANGESRFVELRGSIEMVKMAADQATRAADRASTAAEKVSSAHVEIADLRGNMKAIETALKPIERLTMDMVEGHMADGRRGRS